jgi:hypothetical protein
MWFSVFRTTSGRLEAGTPLENTTQPDEARRLDGRLLCLVTGLESATRLLYPLRYYGYHCIDTVWGQWGLEGASFFHRSMVRSTIVPTTTNSPAKEGMRG